MEELNRKISGIRSMMTDMRAELYAIVNPQLAILDEYIKELYLKVLCTVVQYENNPSEMQILYLTRILKGINNEGTIEEYTRKALEISNVDIQEFISFMKDDLAKYYFALESIVLVTLGNSKLKNNYEYLCEVFELCGITKRELEYLSLVAKSILCQDSKYFEQAKKSINNNVLKLDFSPYIKNFYSGVISDNEDLVYYFVLNQDDCENINLYKTYMASKVKFENMVIDLSGPLEFKGCEIVIFENCKFIGKQYKYDAEPSCMSFIACKKIQILGCKFEHFENSILISKNTQEIIINDSIFIDCNIHNSLKGRGKTGIIIYVEDETPPIVSIYHSEFKNCIGYSGYYNAIALGIVANCKCHVELCKFYNIWNYSYTYDNTYKLIEPEKLQLFTSESENINNEIIGCAKFN